ncbi:MAG TPA: DNA polymerase Y family protein [Devosia sp.]|uniref:Y-family DNA polymerase n=1 Tax=Devosia sp. TaxID=1871048 RepID=UPI002DDCD98E|nr:DNA polymerase Y family protein [Devosia sp.]HEV2517751.1 DNA polymerase Y family protein [Devosia sp.]
MASFQSNPNLAPELSFGERRRHLALSLPRWATDCLRRADPALAASSRPLALWEKQKGAMRLAAVDAAAARANLIPGQNLSDARALVPELEVREIDRAYLEQVFADFADWHSNASPIVAVHTATAPYGDLVLDITGVAHLFGGEAKMLELLVSRLRALGFTVSGAIADTVGAAWALAHFSAGRIIPPGESEAALAALPIVGLRLEEAQVAGLNQMGLKTIGQLYGRERRALQARFGASLIERLDQALGRIEERITPRLPIAEYYAERRFAEPIGYMDDVLMTARDLAIQLGLRLEAEGIGAQTFHLLLYRVDHKVMNLTINAGRATRDPDHIAQLFVHRSERLEGEYDAGFGIDMIRLAASSLSEVESTQLGAFVVQDGARDLDRLYDRMTSRLGPLALTRSKFVNTHIPERATKLEPVIAQTEDDPEALPDPELRRPLRLLPNPEPINVMAEVPHGPPMRIIWRRIAYRILKASGPERIEAEWWRSGKNLEVLERPERGSKRRDPRDDPKQTDKPKPKEPEHVSSLAAFDPLTTVRDYYVIEDDGGRRFWIFRIGLYGAAEAPRWFLHGFFA